MRKRILLTLAIVAMLACLFAISVSADSIVSSTSDAYGTLCQFDEAIGNTQISNLKDDGTIARTVLSDGNGNYYTVPTVYVLTEHSKNRGNGVQGEMFNLSFGEITSKLGFNVTKNSIIRIEFPSDIKFICSGNENLSGCENMVECIMNDGVYFWDNNSGRKVFTNCKKLKSIDVSGMIMDRDQTTFAMFEYCPELEYVKLPDAYQNADGTYMDYNTSHMFSGCNKLKTIENADGFFRGDKTLNYKTFYNCWVLEEIALPYGLETIEGRAIGACKAITSIVIPNTVTVIGTGETVFDSCASLKKVVLPNGPVSFGDYCFEKCTALEAVWMPSNSSTFGKQVFGQCGADSKVTFYFTTATNTITIDDMVNNKDPFITALNTENDTRIKYNTPLSTFCAVFNDGVHKIVGTNPCVGVCSVCSETAISHAQDAQLGVRVVYTSFAKAGEKITGCVNDGCDFGTSETLNPLFICQGYSANTLGGISVGFRVDAVAIATYTELTGKAVSYGVFAVSEKNLGEGDIFDAEGKEIAGSIVSEIVRTDFVGFDVKITGFTAETEGALLAMGAYVAVSDDEGTEYSYIQAENPENGAKYSFTSYSAHKPQEA